MNNLLSRSIGWLSTVIGISTLMGIVFYWSSFHIFNGTLLLMISTFMIAIGALLNIMLVQKLHLNFRAQSPRFSKFVLLAGMLGSLIALIGSALDLLSAILGHSFDVFPLSQTRSILVVGFAFIGIWLLLLNYDARFYDLWPRGLAWSGVMAGLIMMTGLLALPRLFIPYVSLYHEIIPEFGELLGNVGWMACYPIWCLWFGYVCLKGRHRGQILQGFLSRSP